VALLTPEARDFRSDEPVVLCEQVGPGTVADGCGTDGRVDDVGEEQGGEDAVRLRLVVESADEALDLVERGVAIALPGQMVVARQLDDAEVGGSSDRLRPPVDRRSIGRLRACATLPAPSGCAGRLIVRGFPRVDDDLSRQVRRPVRP
jgi:hypothetical protein